MNFNPGYCANTTSDPADNQDEGKSAPGKQRTQKSESLSFLNLRTLSKSMWEKVQTEITEEDLKTHNYCLSRKLWNGDLYEKEYLWKDGVLYLFQNMRSGGIWNRMPEEMIPEEQYGNVIDVLNERKKYFTVTGEKI